MHEAVKLAVDALEGLASQVGNTWNPQYLREGWNSWNMAAVNRVELASMARRLVEQLRAADPSELSAEVDAALRAVPRKTQWLLGDTVPHIFNGNANQAVPAYVSTLAGIETIIAPLVDWQKYPGATTLPKAMARRLRAMQARLDNLAPDMDKLESQIQQIDEATAAADSLPVDLEELRQAKDTVTRVLTEVAALQGKLEDRRVQAEQATQAAIRHREDAEKLVRQCEEAYRITTSTGLAGAFEQRAKRLNTSMWGWVFLLVGALGTASFLGGQRVQILSAELSKPVPQMNAVAVHVLLAVFSIAAPIWLAWLATKQIGQRFRLSEDYAFKASVAKAYEGYRREAARIDEDMEARLFASALTRLEEAPLRLVETETHGSPWHEMVNSKAFQQVISTVPELQSRMSELVRDVTDRITATVQKSTRANSDQPK